MPRKKRTRTRYSPEFEVETVRLLRSGRKQSELAKELGISESMIREWSRQVEMREGMAPGGVFPGNGKQTRQDEEIRRLGRENDRLRQERDFPGKAAAYFAKEDPE